ncbi:SIS domain-containing protein [Psychromonas hadalis]|uniref:SIS domain-containing protein n=1 Tax=Psychromonas hadalis TaxID=211669 RepID=UPI00041516BF|nr:SIS domain-containing protein [Psychromonas hadalis]
MMNQYLGYSENELEKLKAYWTAKEIEQQPSCWKKTQEIVEIRQADIRPFMDKVFAHENLRIVMTGAGTSAFAGQSLAPSLAKLTGRRIEAIASTDIVSNPGQYFAEDLPTLLVSFARSGNSPESVAAVELADQCLTNCYHLFLTCNKEGLLHKSSVNNSKVLALLMPEETHDKSFAMTSSFSSMMIAAISVLSGNEEMSEKVAQISQVTETLIAQINSPITEIASCDYERVIYLGSGTLQGLAQESALKLLELTAGEVVATFDSPLGFRHGPKSIVNNKTLIVVFISNDAYTRKYDLDLLKELRRDKSAGKVIAITAQSDQAVTEGEHFYVTDMQAACDTELLFPYMIFAQIYAFHRAISLNNSPDNPCPTGEVNRVVQGVTIHSFNS